MNRIRAWWSAHKPTKRRLIQLYAALLFNANLKGFGNGKIYTGGIKNICTPGLNCYSCPGAVGACPMGALQNALSSSDRSVPFYMLGIILLYGLLFGRWICGFLCPFGLIQDLLHKINTPKVGKSRLTRILSHLKYVILAFFVVLIPLLYVGFPMPGFCKYICPAGTLEGAVGLLSNPANEGHLAMLGSLFTWKFLLMVVFLVGAVFIYRIFCRFICPLGAIYGFFNKIALVGVKLDRDSCTDCGLCIGKCKMDIRHVGDRECINCGECIKVCPVNAIQWKGPKILFPPQAIGGEIRTKSADTPTPVPAPDTVAAVAPDAEVLTQAPVLDVTVENPTMPADMAAAADDAAPEATETSADVAETATEAEPAAEVTEVEDARAAEPVEAVAENKPVDKKPNGEKRRFDPIGAIKNFNYRKFFDRLALGREAAEYEGPKSGEQLAYESARRRYFIVRVALGVVLFALLLTVLLVANLGDKVEENTPSVTDTETVPVETVEGETTGKPTPPVGSEVGNLCPGMDLELYNHGGGIFNVDDNRGKVTVINFWGTWCGPCIEELPHFDAVARDHAEDVTVLAVHTGFISSGSQHPSEWIPENYPDTPILFAQDLNNKQYGDFCTLLGGTSGIYPMTVIVDADGVITCVRTGKMSHEQLVAEVEKALGN